MAVKNECFFFCVVFFSKLQFEHLLLFHYNAAKDSLLEIQKRIAKLLN